MAARYRSQVTGYLTHIDVHLLSAALEDAQDAEICLNVTLGDHVTYGDILATVRDGNLDRAEDIARKVATALTISVRRDLAHDPTTGIDELANIAWTSGSTAKHNPEIAREALYALEDLTARWFSEDPVDLHLPSQDALAVVYEEGDRERILRVFQSMLVVAQESHQTPFAAAVLEVYASLIERVEGALRGDLRADLDASDEIISSLPESPEVDRARRSVS